MKRLIAPSLLAADFAHLGDEVRAVEKAGADLLHFDIMDGHFVPNLTMGSEIVRLLRPLTKLPFDCHLMVEHPQTMIEPFAKAGANWISAHVETDDLATTLKKIQSHGCKAGAVINPLTPLENIFPFLSEVNFVLVMTVHPGFAGQAMIPSAIEKISLLKKYREEKNLHYLIEVDGGVNAATVKKVYDADVIVAGNGIFKEADYAAAIAALR